MTWHYLMQFASFTILPDNKLKRQLSRVVILGMTIGAFGLSGCMAPASFSETQLSGRPLGNGTITLTESAVAKSGEKTVVDTSPNPDNTILLGMTPEQVTNRFGPPLSIKRKSDMTIFVYNQDDYRYFASILNPIPLPVGRARIELMFKGGHLANIKNLISDAT